MKALKDIAGKSYNELRAIAKELGIKLKNPSKEELQVALENVKFENKVAEEIKQAIGDTGAYTLTQTASPVDEIKKAMDDTKQESAGLFDLPPTTKVVEAEKANKDSELVELSEVVEGDIFTYPTGKKLCHLVDILEDGKTVKLANLEGATRVWSESLTQKVRLVKKSSVMTKTEQAIKLWNAGDKRGALRIFKTFKAGVSKEEQEMLNIAHEVSGVDAGRILFYKSIGVDIDYVMELVSSIVETKWIKKQ